MQDRFEDNRNLAFTYLQTFRPGLAGSFGYSDSRVFNRSIAVGGSFQDFIINDKSLTAGGTFNEKYEKLRVDMGATSLLSNGERTYKTDQSLAAGASGGVGYNVVGQRLVVQARGAYRASADQSQSIDSLYTGLGGSEDSVVAAIRLAATDSVSVRADYQSYHGEREYLDQAVGSLGGQLSGAQNVLLETETRETRSTILAMNASIWPGIRLKLSTSHDEQLFDYLIQTTRYSRTVGDGVNGTLSYTMPWKTVSTFQFENSATLRDLGPQSIASTRDKRKRVSLSLDHSFTKSFTMGVIASTQLQQSFYVDYADNPRDRDQVDDNVSFHLSSTPFKKISANVSVSYTSTQFINIDSTQSSNNRQRQLYEFRPGFTYYITPQLTLNQTYGLGIEYTKYVYTQQDNFLDRNITLTNTVDFAPASAIRLYMGYYLILHDTGSYLPSEPGGIDLLDISSTDRRDRMVLRAEYTVGKGLTFLGENQYSHFLTRDKANGFETVTTDGQIKVGASGTYKWREDRTLVFHMYRVKRFSPYGSEKEKNYWDMNSEFHYSF